MVRLGRAALTRVAESRNRLKLCRAPDVAPGLVKGRFNHDGSLFGIAAGYDWCQGPSMYNSATQVLVYEPRAADITLRQ